MRGLVRSISILLFGSLLMGQCFGFGTGSHFDLTHTVLAEHGFRDTPIKIVQVENWLTDYYSTSPTYRDKHRTVLEKLHFDNLFNDEQVKAYWAILLRNLKSSTEIAAYNNDQLSMLVILGVGLHAVQDFYSHSNWVELHPSADTREFRADTFVRTMRSPTAESIIGLHTGKYPDDRTSGRGPFPIPMNAEVHGGYHNGLNKDSPMRAHWDESYVFAYAGSHEVVGAMEKWAEKVRPGFWRSITEYVVDAANEKKLNDDVAAARSMSMWLEGKGQNGTWKGEGSGSARFFAKFSSNWITGDSSVFVKAIRDGRIHEQLAADLYSSTYIPGIPEIEPFSLQRSAVVIKVTYVAESKKRNFVQRGFAKLLGGSDFYSRIIAGGQEFWGRAIQKSREAVEPWYEIFIVDRKTTEVPISISVWDEDHTDPAKDEHIDINPAAGVFDLKMVIRSSDCRLSGDINGIFNSIDKTFSAEGRQPEKRRAVILGFVTQRLIR